MLKLKPEVMEFLKATIKPEYLDHFVADILKSGKSIVSYQPAPSSTIHNQTFILRFKESDFEDDGWIENTEENTKRLIMDAYLTKHMDGYVDVCWWNGVRWIETGNLPQPHIVAFQELDRSKLHLLLKN